MKRSNLLFIFLLSACTTTQSASNNTLLSLNTTIPPTVTQTSTPEPTETPVPTSTIIPTPELEFVIFGSPFNPNCGDGVPIIWSNDSQNGPFKPDKIGEHWGHMDMMVPEGCEANEFTGEVIAPANGTINTYDYGDPASIGYHLSLPDNTFPEGIFEVFEFTGVTDFDISGVSRIIIDFGHLDPLNVVSGFVTKGQPIADIIEYGNHQKIGYQIKIWYKGVEYMLSPTLFPTLLSSGTNLEPMIDNTSKNWTCAIDSYAKNFENNVNDCIPERHDYKP